MIYDTWKMIKNIMILLFVKRNTCIRTPIPRIHTRYLCVSVTTERYDANSYANYRAYCIVSRTSYMFEFEFE